MAKFIKEIKNEISNSIIVKEKLKEEAETIEKISKIIIKTIKSGNMVFFIGNGGSAADAQHIAAELVGQYNHKIKRRGLPAMALTTNSSILTAIANDISFENVFERQVEAFVRENDVIIGISTSGRSKNIIKAMDLAKTKKAITIAFTGANENPLSKISDISLHVPSTNTQKIQECHITAGHIICALVERECK